jgi:endonuclease-3 related protein
MKSYLSICDIYKLLLNYYGKQKWWPADSTFEIVVGAILTQNTNWKNVELAIKNLKNNNLLNPYNLYNVNKEILIESIKPAGFYNQKLTYLKNISKFIINELDGDIENLKKFTAIEARNKLLSIKGIGFETADSILLYAIKIPVFIIDVYTKRFLTRINIPIPSDSYNNIQRFIEDQFNKDVNLFSEFHALIVEHSKKYCRKKPLCSICFLNSYCK